MPPASLQVRPPTRGSHPCVSAARAPDPMTSDGPGGARPWPPLGGHSKRLAFPRGFSGISGRLHTRARCVWGWSGAASSGCEAATCTGDSGYLRPCALAFWGGPPTPVGTVVPRAPRAVLTLGHRRHLGGRTVVPSQGFLTCLHSHCSPGGQDVGSGAWRAVFQHLPAHCSLHIGPRSPAGPQPGRGTPRAPVCQQTWLGACSAASRGL